MSTNSKTAIQEIKNLMMKFGFLNENTLLRSFKLQDNTIVEAKDLKVGEKITKINEEFERVALESGSHILSERFEVTVKDGKIVKVKEFFLDATLKDGTQIKVEGDSVVEGAKVMVVSAEGEIPAPDGVHELEDGSKVETKDAVIVKVEPAMAEEEPSVEVEIEAKQKMEDVPVESEVPAEVADIAEPVVNAIVEAIVPVLEEVKSLTEEMKKMKEKMESFKNDFESFKKEPAGKKIADGKTEFNKVSKTSQDDMIAGIMRLREINK